MQDMYTFQASLMPVFPLGNPWPAYSQRQSIKPLLCIKGDLLLPRIKNKYQKSINGNFLTIKYVCNPILEYSRTS